VPVPLSPECAAKPWRPSRSPFSPYRVRQPDRPHHLLRQAWSKEGEVVDEDGEVEVKEDDKDEYHAPYLAH
jgi:hypothetical protein